MLRAIHSSSKFARRRRQSQRGVALITTLLLLLLMIGLSLAMVLSSGSDMFINSYYRNFRGSFYAADSGLNIVRQDMMAQILKNVSATFGAGVQPIPPGTDAIVLNYINTTYGGTTFKQLSNSGQAASSWPEAYRIDPAKTVFQIDPNPAIACTTDNNTPCSAPVGAKVFTYTYDYAITAIGQSAKGTERATLTDQGTLVFTANIIPATSLINFAGYGMFIDNFPICSGTLVPGLITGPVFTNGAWTFGNSGTYTFTDSVGSVSGQAGYNFGGSCDQIAGNSDTKSGKTIAPTFQGGFNMNSQKVPLPTDSYNQERAVLDSIGTAGQPSSTDKNAALKDVNGNAYPTSAPTSGVFLPMQQPIDPVTGKPQVDASGKPVFNFTGGGILVEGDAKVTLAATGTAPVLSQVYQINQGGVITTITVTPSAGTPGSGTTVIQQGTGTPTTINGVPVMKDPATATATGDATMLYVNGNITGLSGTAEG